MDRLYKFAEAAEKSRTTLTTMRYRCDSGDVTFEWEVNREVAKWRRFSALDVIRLRFISELTPWGVPVAAANAIFTKRLLPSGIWSGWGDGPYEQGTRDAVDLLRHMLHHELVVRREPDWDGDCRPLREDRTVPELPNPASVVLVFNLSVLAKELAEALDIELPDAAP